MSDDFCLLHGYEYMRSPMGNPIAYCEKCDGRTDAMSDDIVQRCRVLGENLQEVAIQIGSSPYLTFIEAADKIERLRRTLQLHAGDVASLSGELDEWRERALAAEAEIERLREEVRLNRAALGVTWSIGEG